MSEKKFRIRISEGNRKMGFIPSVSLPAVKTCAAGVPCAAECHVVRNMYGGPWRKSIIASHNANLGFLTADRDGFFSQIARYLSCKDPDFFRFHVSGDWIDSDHLQRVFDLAREFESVRFLAFTKRHDLLPTASRVPRNFALVASRWPGWTKPRRGYYSAWVDYGTENPMGYTPPKSALECPGNCETCGMCWDIAKIGRDVVFKRH